MVFKINARFATTKLAVKVKVENLTVNELWSRFFSNLASFFRSKTNLPLINTKRRHTNKHRYLRIVQFFNVLHILQKVCQCNNISKYVWGNKED